MKTKTLWIVLVFAATLLMMGASTPAIASNAQATPATCTHMDTNSATSSDGTMSVTSALSYNSCTNTVNAESYYEATGSTGSHNIRYSACNTPDSRTGFDYWAMCETITLNSYTFFLSYDNYNQSQQFSYLNSGQSGSTSSLSTFGWSGHGSPSSSNEATAYASYPP